MCGVSVAAALVDDLVVSIGVESRGVARGVVQPSVAEDLWR